MGIGIFRGEIFYEFYKRKIMKNRYNGSEPLLVFVSIYLAIVSEWSPLPDSIEAIWVNLSCFGLIRCIKSTTICETTEAIHY